MKIIVTGGSGFIGSNFIINQLSNSNNVIYNLDKLTYAGNVENLERYKSNKNYTFLHTDILNREIVNGVFKKFLPDALINFAAETHVDRSIDSPKCFFDTNIMGLLNLLEISQDYCKINKNFRFIHISTDEVYGSLNKDDLPFSEDSNYKPSSPYSASKAGGDHLVHSWIKTYGLPAIITNCSNNYGPNQFPEKLIPLMIANCIDEKPLPIYGNGENIRDWLYVQDHCDAINSLIYNGELGEKYNIGGNNEIKNIDIVYKICSILDKIKPRIGANSYSELITFVDDRPGHDFRYAIDSSKIQNKINWKPKETFESGIFKTVEWYIDNESWWREIQNNKYNQERLGQIK